MNQPAIELHKHFSFGGFPESSIREEVLDLSVSKPEPTATVLPPLPMLALPSTERLPCTPPGLSPAISENSQGPTSPMQHYPLGVPLHQVCVPQPSFLAVLPPSVPTYPFGSVVPVPPPMTLRPFKAYTSGRPGVLETTLGCENSQEYLEFRQRVLSRTTVSSTTNKNMRRNSNASNPKSDDPEYLEKRRKNNEAAKRSRDARKAKEDELAVKCTYLEEQYFKLKYQVKHLTEQLSQMPPYNLRGK